MKSFKDYVQEGVNDPSIFKAVFLAGGPGSGKSFIVGQTALTALGYKVINSDIPFEVALKKAGLTTNPEDIFSPKGQEVRKDAKKLTSKRLDLALMGRLGLVIDGTGKDYDKIKKQSDRLRELGYDISMIFVNTDLETALQRNRDRSRSLPDDKVTSMWQGVQTNVGKFQNLFGKFMYIVDNSNGSNWKGATMSAYKLISKWSKTEPKNPIAKAWIKKQKSGK